MHKKLKMFVEVIFVVADDINVWIQDIVNISKVFSTKNYGNSYPEIFFYKKMTVELWNIFRKSSDQQLYEK